MKRVRLWVPVGLCLLVAGLWLSRDILARHCLRRLTGLTAEVHSQSFGWTRGRFEVRDLVCTNLHRGNSRITADVPVLSIEYAPWSLVRRQLHIYDLTCEVRALTIIREARVAAPATSGAASRSIVRVDVVRLKLDGTLAYEQQTLTGKFEAILRDVEGLDSLRALFSRL